MSVREKKRKETIAHYFACREARKPLLIIAKCSSSSAKYARYLAPPTGSSPPSRAGGTTATLAGRSTAPPVAPAWRNRAGTGAGESRTSPGFAAAVASRISWTDPRDLITLSANALSAYPTTTSPARNPVLPPLLWYSWVGHASACHANPKEGDAGPKIQPKNASPPASRN